MLTFLVLHAPSSCSRHLDPAACTCPCCTHLHPAVYVLFSCCTHLAAAELGRSHCRARQKLPCSQPRPPRRIPCSSRQTHHRRCPNCQTEFIPSNTMKPSRPNCHKTHILKPCYILSFTYMLLRIKCIY